MSKLNNDINSQAYEAKAKCKHMVEHFSVSQLNMYLRCPAQYAFRYLDGIVLPPTGSLTKGRAVHKGAEYNYRQKVKTARDAALEEIQDIVAAAFDREAEKTSWEKEEDKGRIKDETLLLTALYHQKIAPQVQPLFIEHEFKIPLAEGMPLLGYIDVIDENFIIRDLKTASKTPGENEAAKNLQLTAYAYAFRELVGREESAVALDYLVQTKQPKAVVLMAQRTKADIDRLWAIMFEVLKAIKGGNFYPNPQNIMCSVKACGYWDQCRQRYGGRLA